MSDYFIETTGKLRNLFYNLFYLILCSFAKIVVVASEHPFHHSSEIIKDDILWPWIGVDIFPFSSMFIVEQQGSRQFK